MLEKLKDRLTTFKGGLFEGPYCGLELELEDVGEVAAPHRWKATDEPSLRNGVEFVLKEPLSDTLLKNAVMRLCNVLGQATFTKSIRCSTHVHCNVSDMSNFRIYEAVLTYLLIEDILVSTQGPDRVGNLHCLRASDAGSIIWDLHTSLDTSLFSYFNQNNHKYGAVNLAAVKKYGSLEFRFFRPMSDETEIMAWLHGLSHLIRNSSTIGVDKIIEKEDTMSIQDLLKLLVGEELACMLVLSAPADVLERGLSNTVQVGSVYRKLKRMQMQQEVGVVDGSEEFEPWLHNPKLFFGNPLLSNGFSDEGVACLLDELGGEAEYFNEELLEAEHEVDF